MEDVDYNNHPHLLVNHFLMASYLYYIKDYSLFTDVQFDYICNALLALWDSIESPFKYIIDKDSLKTGSGFYIKEEEYPAPLVRLSLNIMNNEVPYESSKL